MRKFLSISLLAILLALGSTSCSNDDNYKVYYSYGTVMPRESGEVLRIRKDAGSYLTVTRAVRGSVEGLTAGDRIIVYYEPDGKLVEGGDNNIIVHSIYQVVTKDPLLNSELTGSENTSLGDDGMLLLEADFGGEYVNVYFQMYFGIYSTRRHLVNVVAEDVGYDGTTLTLTFRHHAQSDIPENNQELRIVNGMISFNLVHLFEEMNIDPQIAATNPNVKLVWKKYKGNTANMEVEEISLGKFKPWTIEGNPSITNLSRSEGLIE